MKHVKTCFPFLFLFLFFFATVSFAQKGNIGLGVKAGDPTGISAKLYGANPIELVIGRGHYFSGYYNDYGYYEKRFDKYDRFKGRGYQFYNYSVGTPIAIQLHWLKQQPLKSYKPLEWYLGVGPQFRSYRVVYFYREYYGPKGNDYYLRQEQLTDYDLGVDGVIGLEYTFKDLPLTIFGDVNLFLELIDQPFRLSFQGGLGVRYNLK